MLITDFLEDIHKAGGNEIEFWLCDSNGDTKRLELYIAEGKYIYEVRDTDIIAIALTETKDA